MCFLSRFSSGWSRTRASVLAYPPDGFNVLVVVFHALRLFLNHPEYSLDSEQVLARLHGADEVAKALVVDYQGPRVDLITPREHYDDLFPIDDMLAIVI